MRNASLWIDLRIIMMTIRVVLRGRVSSQEILADTEQVQRKNYGFEGNLQASGAGTSTCKRGLPQMNPDREDFCAGSAFSGQSRLTKAQVRWPSVWFGGAEGGREPRRSALLRRRWKPRCGASAVAREAGISSVSQLSRWRQQLREACGCPVCIVNVRGPTGCCGGPARCCGANRIADVAGSD